MKKSCHITHCLLQFTWSHYCVPHIKKCWSIPQVPEEPALSTDKKPEVQVIYDICFIYIGLKQHCTFFILKNWNLTPWVFDTFFQLASFHLLKDILVMHFRRHQWWRGQPFSWNVLALCTAAIGATGQNGWRGIMWILLRKAFLVGVLQSWGINETRSYSGMQPSSSTSGGK